jgi:hypothetical protein
MIPRERDLTVRQGHPIPLNWSFLQFPSKTDNYLKRELGRFPVALTIAIPTSEQRHSNGTSSFEIHPKAEARLSSASSLLFSSDVWFNFFMHIRPTERLIQRSRRYNWRSNKSTPVVIDASLIDSQKPVTRLDILRAAGMAQALGGKLPQVCVNTESKFQRWDTSGEIFTPTFQPLSKLPIDRLHELPSATGLLDLKRKLYSELSNEPGPQGLPGTFRELEINNALRTLFCDLHAFRQEYVGKAKTTLDAVTDFSIDQTRAAAIALNENKDLSVRFCPTCLNPLGPGAKSNRTFCTPACRKAWARAISRSAKL